MKIKALTQALMLATALGTASAAYAADEVKVGFLTTLSGPGASNGQEIRDGFMLALKLNDGKLGGLPAKVLVTDDQLNPVAARQTVERYIKRDDVDVVTGMVFSAVALPVIPTVLAADKVFISTNTGPATYAGEKCDPNFFVVSWQNEDIPRAMGAFATERGFKNVAIIAPNYPGGRETADGFKRDYKGNIAEEIYTKLNQLDYSAEIATLRAVKPDAVFYFLPGGMGVNFVKQYTASGMPETAPLLTTGFTAGVADIQALGQALLGTYNSSQWAADLPNEANKKFVEAYRKEYGRMPSMFSSQGYDAAMLIDGAVREVNGKIEDKDAFRAALKNANFESVRGAFRFNNNNYPIQNIYMRQVVENEKGIANKLVGVAVEDLHDVYAETCPLS